MRSGDIGSLLEWAAMLAPLGVMFIIIIWIQKRIKRMIKLFFPLITINHINIIFYIRRFHTLPAGFKYPLSAACLLISLIQVTACFMK